MLFRSFYKRSVSFWPPHIELAKREGEIGAGIDIETATDFIMRLAVSLVTFPDMGLNLKSRKDIRRYLQQVVSHGLG